jgi:hemoglobin
VKVNVLLAQSEPGEGESMKSKQGFLGMMSIALITATLLLARPARTEGQQAPAKKSLYDRLGGAYPISMVVDDFIERLLVNKTLNANPAIKAARERVPKQGLKFHVTTLVCQVTGGPCKYVGRGMKESHAHLNIHEKEWQAMAADFKKSLDKFKVPEAEQKELFDIVGGTKGDIVVPEKA